MWGGGVRGKGRIKKILEKGLEPRYIMKAISQSFFKAKFG